MTRQGYNFLSSGADREHGGSAVGERGAFDPTGGGEGRVKLGRDRGQGKARGFQEATDSQSINDEVLQLSSVAK